MLHVTVPGEAALCLEHLVLDFNGTLAVDGILLDGVAERLRRLAVDLQIHVLTADTFATAASALSGLPCSVRLLEGTAQAASKGDHVQTLGAATVVCVGNGRNDLLMMERAALPIAVLQAEGAYAPTMMAARIVAPSVLDALDLLLHPNRLAATLRG